MARESHLRTPLSSATMAFDAAKNWTSSCQYYKKEVNKIRNSLVNLSLYKLQRLMQQGVELEQYLSTCQCILATFIIPWYHPLVSSKYVYFMPVLQERSKQDTQIYCKLVIILIAEAHATGDGARSIFDYMPKHSSYIHNTPVSITILKICQFHASTTRKK